MLKWQNDKDIKIEPHRRKVEGDVSYIQAYVSLYTDVKVRIYGVDDGWTVVVVGEREDL